MNIMVLGAGVVGVTTAYALARRGCNVTIVDQANTVASGASFANGGQLSYSFVDPMASLPFLLKLPAIALGRDSSIQMKLSTDIDLFKWGVGFAKECLSLGRYTKLREALTLAIESRTELERLLTEHAISFRHRPAGKLVVTRNSKQLSRLTKAAAIKREMGIDIVAVNREQCLEHCSEIRTGMNDIVGGVYAPGDTVGDARRFTEALALYASERYGLKIRLKRKIERLLTDGKQVVGVRTDREDFSADAVVVCLGAAAPEFLKNYAIKAPILPVKGYSVALPAQENTASISLTDLDNKIVFSKLDNEVRIAGLSDFGESGNEINPERVLYLEALAKKLMPNIGDYSHVGKAWAGLRPMTPDGLPITGPTSLRNLYLNTGHGMLGWTFASGSAERLAKSLLSIKQPRMEIAA
ncbi:MAG: FAD-dependent oxidoreductase [Kordiimonas sp.]